MKYLTKTRRQAEVQNYLAGTLSSTMAERTVFTAPYNCEIIEAYLTDTSNYTGDPTNKWVTVLKRKGTAGSGTDTIATVAGTANRTAFIPASMGTLTYSFIPKDTAVTATITKASSPSNTADTLITIVYREI
jgi:hypothetical protein